MSRRTVLSVGRKNTMSDGRKRPSTRRDLREMEEVNSPPPRAAQRGPSRPAGPSKEEAWRALCVPVTDEMMKAEKMLLDRVLIANVIAPRPVSVEDVQQALCAQFKVPSTLIKVCRSYPSDYLVQFAMVDLAKRVNQKGIVPGPGFEIVVWPWSRNEDSDEIAFNVKVEIKIQGIPAHAWHERNVYSLLSNHCCIQNIQMAKFLKGDMSAAYVTAFTSSPDHIPPVGYLTVPEPAGGARLPLPADSVLPALCKMRKGYPIKFTTRVITDDRLNRGREQRGPEEENDSDSPPSGAYDYESPSPGSLETGYGYDSDREPAGWK